jgi:hypothetical protein
MLRACWRTSWGGYAAFPVDYTDPVQELASAYRTWVLQPALSFHLKFLRQAPIVLTNPGYGPAAAARSGRS